MVIHQFMAFGSPKTNLPTSRLRRGYSLHGISEVSRPLSLSVVEKLLWDKVGTLW